MPTVYIADLGFRPAGARLATPVRATDGDRTLTLTDLVATSEGTDVAYYITGVGDEAYLPLREVISIHKGADAHVVTRGTISFGAGQRRMTRQIRSTSVAPAWTGPVGVTIALAGVGEFRLAAELRPFGTETDAPRREVNASVTHEGITVTVRGVGAAREETAIEIEVTVPEGECCVGIGGYHGHRLGLSALSLCDENGGEYLERWQEPGPYDHKTVALFQPVRADARELQLSVPAILVEEPISSDALAVPVTTPDDLRLGRYTIRVLSTRATVGMRTAPTVADQARGLDVEFQPGGWHGDRRIVSPGRPFVDGDSCNLGWTGPQDMRRPEPVTRMKVLGARAVAAKTLAFSRPTIEVRGPWTVRFAIA